MLGYSQREARGCSVPMVCMAPMRSLVVVIGEVLALDHATWWCLQEEKPSGRREKPLSKLRLRRTCPLAVTGRPCSTGLTGAALDHATLQRVIFLIQYNIVPRNTMN